MQVVGGRCPIAVWPQHSHHGFPVQPMAVGERQQLHQRLGLTQAPGVGGHRATGHGDLESTEELDPHACVLSHLGVPINTCRLCPASLTGECFPFQPDRRLR